jgi:hypothetical protein
MTGRPKEKIFKLGAARVATPKPMLIKSMVIITGKEHYIDNPVVSDVLKQVIAFCAIASHPGFAAIIP